MKLRSGKTKISPGPGPGRPRKTVTGLKVGLVRPQVTVKVKRGRGRPPKAAKSEIKTEPRTSSFGPQFNIEQVDLGVLSFSPQVQTQEHKTLGFKPKPEHGAETMTVSFQLQGELAEPGILDFPLIIKQEAGILDLNIKPEPEEEPRAISLQEQCELKEPGIFHFYPNEELEERGINEFYVNSEDPMILTNTQSETSPIRQGRTTDPPTPPFYYMTEFEYLVAKRAMYIIFPDKRMDRPPSDEHIFHVGGSIPGPPIGYQPSEQLIEKAERLLTIGERRGGMSFVSAEWEKLGLPVKLYYAKRYESIVDIDALKVRRVNSGTDFVTLIDKYNYNTKMSQKTRKSPKRNTRQLRDRKERKFYTDDILGDADDDIEGPQSFDLEEKLASSKYTNKPLVKELKGTEFNLAYIQQHGFTSPLLFKDKNGLGIRIPGPNFSVSDVKTCVGSKRMLDVMDVRTQKNLEMTMKQWQEYYDNPVKDRLLNVISLEFSHTKLENYVESPTVVRQLDWVDRVWPLHLKNMQTESTNAIDEMMYPKVQKYCLMSVKGCYTDFHVDFGGTSVWYHILKGAKVFWLIPPTEKNLDLYQAWVLSGKQGDTFFGDNVEDCGRVYLQSGDTFFIPSGWIHAVYTPKDSLVFGGNFLHSFGIDKQLRIAMVEEATKVPQKFRYPFFTEMLWYTLERYAHCLLGHNYIYIPTGDNDAQLDSTSGPQITEKLTPKDIHISPQELHGLKSIVMYLHQLPIQRKNVPAIIYNPTQLLRSVRDIIIEHRYDNPDKAVTGRPILVWPGEKAEDVGKIKPATEKKKPAKANSVPTPTTPDDLSNGRLNKGPQPRVRCNQCQSCKTTEDCNECIKCLSTRNSVCIMRECMAPMLPVLSVCCACGLDGWGDIPGPSAFLEDESKKTRNSTLLECSVCYEISHALCIGNRASEKVLGIVNDDLPNSWECPICIEKSSKIPRPPVKQIKSNPDEHKESTGNVHQLKIPQPVISSASGSLTIQSTLTHSQAEPKPTTVTSVQSGKPDAPSSSKFQAPQTSKKENKSKCGKETILNGNASTTDKSREDEKQVTQKLAQVQQRLLQGRQSLDEVKNGKKGNGKKGPGLGMTIPPARPPPAGKRPVLMANKTAGKQQSDGQPPKKKVAGKRSLSPPGNKKKPAVKRRASEQPTKIKDEEMDVEDDEPPPVLSPMVEINPPPLKKIKVELPEPEPEVENDETSNAVVESKPSPIKFPQRTQLSGRIMTRSAKQLKHASNVVRPAEIKEEAPGDVPIPAPPPPAAGSATPSAAPVPFKKGTSIPGQNKNIKYWKDKELMMRVFQRFPLPLLTKCLPVCKEWNHLALHPYLWRKIDLSLKEITEEIMQGIVRRQPKNLILDWTNISKDQLSWIIQRIPQLRELSLRGIKSIDTIVALKSCACPALTSLDLGYIGGLTDSTLREVLAPPIDSRPGLTDSQSRLRQLKILNLAGASISDVALRYITQHAGGISHLDISTCSRITDAGIAQLGAPDSPCLQNLVSLNVSGCPQLTNISLDHLKLCSSLRNLDIRKISQITLSGLTKFHKPGLPRSRSSVNVLSDFNSRNIYPGLTHHAHAAQQAAFDAAAGSSKGPTNSAQPHGLAKSYVNSKNLG